MRSRETELVFPKVGVAPASLAGARAARLLIRAGGAAALAGAEATAEDTLHGLLAALARLLAPGLPDSAAIGAAPVRSVLKSHLPHAALGPHARRSNCAPGAGRPGLRPQARCS